MRHMRTTTLNIVLVLVVLLVVENRLALFSDESKPVTPTPGVGVTTLAQERDEIATEIETEVLYDPAKAKEAIGLLRRLPQNQSATRNVEDALEAFASVDERFAVAGNLLKQKKFSEAAIAFEKLVNSAAKTYFSAAARWGRVWALHQIALVTAKPGVISDDEIKATDAAAALGQDFYDKLSFALRAYGLAIAGYEKEARLFYAYKQYVGYLSTAEKLGLSNTPEALRIQERVSQLTRDLKNPVGTVVRLMGESHELLQQAQTGQPTRKKQDEIITWLDDLIQTLEERQPKGSPKQQQQVKRPSGNNPSQIGQGRQGSMPKGANRPSSPAQASFLPEGDGRTIGQLETIHPSDRSNEWGKLPPAEREKLLQQMKEHFPDRYREILAEYFKELSEDHPPVAAEAPTPR